MDVRLIQKVGLSLSGILSGAGLFASAVGAPTLTTLSKAKGQCTTSLAPVSSFLLTNFRSGCVESFVSRLLEQWEQVDDSFDIIDFGGSSRCLAFDR